MNTFSPVQMAVASGKADVFDHVDNDGPMWSAVGKRWARTVIQFDAPFLLPPAVQLSIAMIDADSGKNLRLELSTEDVTGKGFTVVAHTWSDTRIGRLQVNWTAIGQSDASSDPLWNV